VFYFDDQQLKGMLMQIVNNLVSRRDMVAATDPQDIRGHFFLLLRSIAHCTKHPGFMEEQEWRVMHTIGLDPPGPLLREVETIAGIPQPVIKLPMRNDPTNGITGITIPEILERVIIGPTQFPEVIGDALMLEMTNAGIGDAQNRLTRSSIPLRT